MKLKVYLTRIAKRDFKLKNGWIKISVYDYPKNTSYEGSFRVKQCIIPEAEVICALVYVLGKKIVAIDEAHLDPMEGFKAARLMSNGTIAPSEGHIEPIIKDYFHLLPLPLRRFKIKVVSHEDELLFSFGGVLFDQLHAYDEFEKGKLIILRDGEIFDETYSIGTQRDCTCFSGIEKISAGNAINATELQTGDILLLEIPAPLDFNLADFLREEACYHAAVIGTLEGKGEMTLTEVREGFVQEVSQTANNFVQADIVRFCPKE